MMTKDEALLALEREIGGAERGLFSKRVTVDAGRCLEYIACIKNAEQQASYADLTDAMRESERILRQANEKAEALLRNAEERSARMVDESFLVRNAEAEAEQIRASAEREARSLRELGRDRLEELLFETERALSDALRIISNSREELKER